MYIRLRKILQGYRLALGLYMLLAVLSLRSYGQTTSTSAPTSSFLQFDVQGDIHYSLYNFTNLLSPYHGIDGWAEGKLSLWNSKDNHIGGLFVSVIPSYTALILPDSLSDPFYWQRYGQVFGGAQVYPFYRLPGDAIRPLNGLRLFAQFGYRKYKPVSIPAGSILPQADFVSQDWHIGMDYYADNLFSQKFKTAFAPTFMTWSNLSYRNTNFSVKGYRALLFTGNLKGGLRHSVKNKTLFYHAIMDWTYVSACPCRWWENYLRTGVGVRFFPSMYKGQYVANRWLRRLNFYAEGYYQVVSSAQFTPAVVKPWDLRVGVNISSSGFVRD